MAGGATRSRSRRDHRPGDRTAEERDVPHAGYRRARRPGARRRAIFRSGSTDPTEREAFECRRSSRRWSSRGWVGAKAGQGFYKKDRRRRDSDARSRDAAIPPAADGAPRRRSMRRAAIEDPRERIRTLFLGEDSVGAVPARRRSGPRCSTPRASRPTIAHSIDDVDRAMRWGFGWELGPFETWDAIGVEQRGRGHSGRRRSRRSSRGAVGGAFRAVTSDRAARRAASIGRAGSADPARREGADGGRPPNAGASLSISATACSASSSTRR